MIGLVGISFKSADIEIREKYAFSDNDVAEFTRILKANPDFRGMLILSTCNRTEIYFHCRKKYEHESFHLILNALSQFRNYTHEHHSSFYFKSGQNAVEHLFKVTSGIDSLIIGEDQIIGQVRDAFKRANENKTIDSILSRLFAKAFEAAKKVKSSTSINQGSASVSSAALDLCQRYFNDFSKCRLMLVGAGQTGQLVLKSLGKRFFDKVYLANRTFQKAEELAFQYSANAIGLDSIAKYLPECDIVIIATDAKSYLVDEIMLRKVRSEKAYIKDQLYIDLSVPRNIDPSISQFDGINLYAVDDLVEIVRKTSQKRNEAVNDALKIISQISEEFMDWLVIRGLAPIFEKIKSNFEQIHRLELDGYVKINGISDHKPVEDYGKHISDKYARLLIRNLRNMVKNGESKDSIEAINELFELA